jgi:DNA repair protein RecN (Recombination protein N)
MLRRLYISNFALINEMDVQFPGHLTVITGETGAGKSIFLEALGLALGKRAEGAALKNKSRKCIIEAEFDARELDLKSFFDENGLEEEKQIVLRREISIDGKSRSFLNDSMISLAALKSLSEKLIDIHSQHQTLLLNQTGFQLELVDAFAGSLEKHKAYKLRYQQLQAAKKQLADLEDRERAAVKEVDYNKYLLNELDEISIEPGQLTSLEAEGEALENAENIKATLMNGAAAISGGEQNITGQLAIVKQQMNVLGKYGKNYQELCARLNSSYIELKDIAAEMEAMETQIHADGARLDHVNAAIDKINRLMKKHGVKSEQELLEIKNELSEKLLQFGSLEHGIEKMKKEIRQISDQCLQEARNISKMRVTNIPAIEKEVKQMLAGLKMENASFKIDLHTFDEPGVTGLEQARFMFSANRGAPLQEIQKVASGGELSRLMLTLKALLATKKELPTIIFDEIDSGVSGDVADKIGNILLQMGNTMQVAVITHLPQIASKGAHHLFVYKKDDEDKTVSYIRQLSKEERVTEIAKMLSTSQPTQSALKNAKELLNA